MKNVVLLKWNSIWEIANKCLHLLVSPFKICKTFVLLLMTTSFQVFLVYNNSKNMSLGRLMGEGISAGPLLIPTNNEVSLFCNTSNTKEAVQVLASNCKYVLEKKKWSK